MIAASVTAREVLCDGEGSIFVSPRWNTVQLTVIDDGRAIAVYVSREQWADLSSAVMEMFGERAK